MRLEETEARRRFAAAGVARLATVGADGEPHLVPVTFAVPGPYALVIGVDDKPKSTRDLRRLRNIAANPRVTLLADRYDADWSRLWWARADGTAVVVTGGLAHARAWEQLRARYPQYGDRVQDGPVIAVDVRRWTGWAYGPAQP